MKDILNVLGRTEDIRNVCFLAHVDHGKTTLSDSLISTVGIISERLSGKLRYLDNRDDEQRRMITIKSSSISLLYTTVDRDNEDNIRNRQILINLVDSPGHVDFSVEVSTAARLCDGALLIVDVVEGICPQTRAVLRQAWHESVKTVLVLNKLDKLILDLNMSPSEAYRRMYDLVEQVNALVYRLHMEELSVTDDDIDTSFIKSDDWFYSPSKGNVAFCSAIHRWCVYIPDFVHQVSQKLGITSSKIDVLQSAFWGDYYYCNKTKSVKMCKNNEKPLFVQFVLEQIWKVYNAVITWDVQTIIKISQHSNTKFTARQSLLLEETQTPSNEDRDELLQTIMGSWIPLCGGLLKLAVHALPSPISAAGTRLKRICPAIINYDDFDKIASCDPSTHTVIHIAKFLGCDLRHMRLTKDVLQGDEQAGDFVAFSRIFSGTVKAGDKLYICNNGPDNIKLSRLADDHATQIYVKRVMICMGADLIDIDVAWPGNIVTLSLSYTLDDNDANTLAKHDYVKDVMAWLLSLTDPHRSKLYTNCGDYNRNRISSSKTLCSVARHLTLSSDSNFPSFSPPTCEFNNSILRVSIEPQNVRDINQLLVGLSLLYTADPAVELDILKTGEYLLACCGEIHLERCINDLVNLYAKVPINVSKLRVSIREGIVDINANIMNVLSKSLKVNFPPWSSNEMLNEKGSFSNREHSTDKGQYIQVNGADNLYITSEALSKGTEYIVTVDDIAIFVRATQMPAQVLNYLDTNNKDIKSVIYSGEIPLRYNTNNLASCLKQIESDIYSFLSGTKTTKKCDYGHLWGISLNRGTRCLLFYNDNSCIYTKDVLNQMIRPPPLKWRFSDSYERIHPSVVEYSKFVSNLISGFEIACQSGPLTEEPLRGVIYVVEGIYIATRPAIVNEVLSTPDRISSMSISDARLSYRSDMDVNISSHSVLFSDGCSVSSKPSPSHSQYSGKTMSSIKSLFRHAYMQRGRPRIYEVMLRLDLQCDQSVLGKIYSVLQKRRTQVTGENVKDGSCTFMIEALMPASESFGLAQDLRSKTSGGVIFHLQFSHWELITEDPFPEVSMTDEELEDDGFNMALLIQSNVPRKIINHIRKIKGLQTEEKVVIAAEKQRTLSTKK